MSMVHGGGRALISAMLVALLAALPFTSASADGGLVVQPPVRLDPPPNQSDGSEDVPDLDFGAFVLPGQASVDIGTSIVVTSPDMIGLTHDQWESISPGHPAPEGPLPLPSLEEVELPVAEVQAMPESSAGAAPTQPSPVIAIWYTRKRPGYHIIRWGTYNLMSGEGWGLVKTILKHNVGPKAVQTATRHWSPVRQGTSLVYQAEVDRYQCTTRYLLLRSCTVVDKVTLKTVMETNSASSGDGWERGLITSYCIGSVRCPLWVEQALNAGS